MKLGEVIKLLIQLREMHGDIPVFVNGEYGESCPEKAETEHFSVGEAEITLGCDNEDIPTWLNPKDKIMQIGGY